MAATNLQVIAARLIATADFRDFWPLDVRKALVRAANHDGDFPPFGEKEARWALAQARDIAVGEATLSHAQRQAVAR